MSPWPERRSISSARILTGLAADYGVTPEQCLRGTGIPVAHLEDNTREIDARQELRIVDNLLDACGGFRPGMGLAAGLRYHLTSYGIWGYALISSPTLRDAIQMGMRYLDLSFAFVRVRFEEEPDRARLVLDSSAIPSACRAFLLERDMACIIALVEDLFGVRMPLQAAWFTGAAPRDLTPFIKTFGVTPLYEQAENAVVFGPSFLDLSIPQANTLTASICETQCRDLLERRKARSGQAGRVREELLRQPRLMPDMETVAARLSMSSRTLRRHLDDEGVSFRQLVDEIRMALAEEMLAIPGMTMEDISARLGYSEVSNFLHAFKRCKGVTPSQYRQSRA